MYYYYTVHQRRTHYLTCTCTHVQLTHLFSKVSSICFRFLEFIDHCSLEEEIKHSHSNTICTHVLYMYMLSIITCTCTSFALGCICSCLILFINRSFSLFSSASVSINILCSLDCSSIATKQNTRKFLKQLIRFDI